MNHNTFGAEIEKPVALLKTGGVYGVSQSYFKMLAQKAKERKDGWEYHKSDIKPEVILGVKSDTLGEQGLDNAFNLLETSLPYTSDLNGLTKLNELMLLDLKITQECLEKEGATIINFSNHPLGKTDLKTYRKYVAPKGVYNFIWHRKWDHAAGIDAKAQNSPATGVDPFAAIDAFSVILGFASVFIALFANSPIAEGKITGDQENRQRIWERMMAGSISEGDRITARFPAKRFHTLKEYLVWMFGPGTNIHFVVDTLDYKTSGQFLLIDNFPAVLDYLSGTCWPATVLGTKEKLTVKPHLSHLEVLQFTQFSGARIRWAFNLNASINNFLEAMEKDKVEDWFSQNAKYTYIEGRDPGANFPDAEICNESKDIAKSVIISPSAIQAGLIKNLKDSVRLLNKYNWRLLGKLKEEAIKNGLSAEVSGVKVKDLSHQVLEIADSGLAQEEKWMLSYPKWILKTGKNGAQRALDFLEHDQSIEKIRQLILKRKAVILK